MRYDAIIEIRVSLGVFESSVNYAQHIQGFQGSSKPMDSIDIMNAPKIIVVLIHVSAFAIS
jgi:hypothetical protein